MPIWALDDPYVEAKHLEIVTDSSGHTLLLKDQQTTNGTKCNGSDVSDADISVSDTIIVGRTRLRIFHGHTPVPKALKLSALEENLAWLNSWPLAIVLACIVLVALLTGDYLNTFTEFKLAEAIPKTGSQLVIMSLWPLFLGLLAKLAKKESHLLSLFNLLWIFVLTIISMNKLNHILLFNLSQSSLLFGLFSLLLGAALFAFIWFSLFIAYHQSNLRRNILSTVATLIVVVPVFIVQFLQSDRFSKFPRYNAVLMPPGMMISTPQNTQDFLKDSEALFEELDAKRNKKLKEQK